MTMWPELHKSSSTSSTPAPAMRTMQTGCCSCSVQMRLMMRIFLRLASLPINSKTSSPFVASKVMRAPFSSEPSRLTKARKTSDSVMMPARIFPRITGSAPILCWHISAATSSIGVSVVVVRGLAVMICPTMVGVRRASGPSMAKGLTCGGNAWITSFAEMMPSRCGPSAHFSTTMSRRTCFCAINFAASVTGVSTVTVSKSRVIHMVTFINGFASAPSQAATVVGCKRESGEICPFQLANLA